VIAEAGSLSGEPVLPGFKLSLRRLFAEAEGGIQEAGASRVTSAESVYCSGSNEDDTLGPDE
jgi:hypothetical protein